jgi:outer membrane protein assembly factor BamB
MWRADPTHSSTAQVGPSNLNLAWKFTANGSIIASPSVVNGITYFGSQDSYIYAVGAFSGNLIWKFQTDDQQVSSVAVANGKVYTGGDDGYVYCLDANSGSQLWKTFVDGDQEYTYGSFVLKSSPAVVNGVVYVGSEDGNMYALNGDSGSIIWKFKTAGPIHSSPAVSDGAVYFTSEEPSTGMLYKVNASSGVQLWKQAFPCEYQFTGGTEMLGSPSVEGGMVFASSDLRSYYGVNAATGDIVWSFMDPAAMEFIASSPLYVDGQIFVIDKFSIMSLNASTGKTNWSFFTGDELYTSMSYADGKLYMMTSQRHIYILDANNHGEKLATYETPSGSWSSPTIANERLYIGNHDWNVYCFSGKTASTMPTTTPNDVPSQPVDFLLIGVFLAALIILIVGMLLISRKLRTKMPKP